MADTNKALATKPTAQPLPLKAPPSTPTTATTTPSTTLASPPRPFKRLTPEEMVEWRRAVLCFNYEEPFTQGHKCKHLFNITAINDYDMDDIDNSLIMMIGTNQSPMRGYPPMYLLESE